MTNHTIMVLEDDALVALDIEMTLRRAGHDDVTVCHSLEAAMLHIKDQVPDISFLDFNLGPGKTSIPVAERLYDLDAPFAFLSSYAHCDGLIPDDMSKIDHMSKPFREAELIIAVRRLAKKQTPPV